MNIRRNYLAADDKVHIANTMDKVTFEIYAV